MKKQLKKRGAFNAPNVIIRSKSELPENLFFSMDRYKEN
jgi:hypothetical protein